MAALKELTKLPKPDRVQELRFIDVIELTVDILDKILTLFPKLERLVLTDCAALDLPSMARWEPRVQIGAHLDPMDRYDLPVLWSSRIRSSEAMKNQGRSFSVAFRWLWQLRENFKQGAPMTILSANLWLNYSLRDYLLTLLAHGPPKAHRGRAVSADDVYSFVVNRQAISARQALIVHVFWSHKDHPFDKKSNLGNLVLSLSEIDQFSRVARMDQQWLGTRDRCRTCTMVSGSADFKRTLTEPLSPWPISLSEAARSAVPSQPRICQTSQQPKPQTSLPRK